MDSLLPFFVGLAMLVIATTLGVAVRYFVRWLETDKRLKSVRGVLVRLTDAVIVAVKATQQQTVEKLKRDASDGKLTRIEIDIALTEALQRVRLYLSEHGVSEAKRVLGGASPLSDEEFAKLVRVKIEAAVLDLKQRREEPRVEAKL